MARTDDAAAVVPPSLPGAVEGFSHHLCRVGARRLRLHDSHIRAGRHPAEFLGKQGPGRPARHRDAAVSRVRRHRGRHLRRPLRPQGSDPVLDRVVHAVRVPERCVHHLCDALRVSGPVRHRHGRHVGGRHAAGPRALAAAPAWHRVGLPAGRLLVRLPALVAGLSARLPLRKPPARMGVAHHAVVGGGASRDHLPGDVDGAREPDLARSTQKTAGGRRQRAAVARPPVRSRSAMGHPAHLAADGHVRVGLPVHDVLVSHFAHHAEVAAALVSAAAERGRPAGRHRPRRDV